MPCEKFNFINLRESFYVGVKHSRDLILRDVLVMLSDNSYERMNASCSDVDLIIKSVVTWSLFWNGLILPGIRFFPLNANKKKFFFQLGDFLNSLIMLFRAKIDGLSCDVNIDEYFLQALIPSPRTAFSRFSRDNLVFYEELTRSNFFTDREINLGVWQNMEDVADNGIRKICKLNLFICLARLFENLRNLRSKNLLPDVIVKLILALDGQVFNDKSQFNSDEFEGFYLAKQEWILLRKSMNHF